MRAAIVGCCLAVRSEGLVGSLVLRNTQRAQRRNLHQRQQQRRRASPHEQPDDDVALWSALGRRAAQKVEEDVAKGARLLVCPTPLGESSDATFRSVAALRRADVIACEDTRKTGLLLKELGVVREGRLVRHDATTAGRTVGGLVHAMSSGDVVALVSDAGTPGISDPGAYLVQVAIAAGIYVVALPGACAATTALSVSGVDSASGFRFFGFASGRTPTQRRRELARMLDQAEAGVPVVLYESPRRVRDTVHTLSDLSSSRLRLVVARELTKTHQDVFRGDAAECLAWIDSGKAGGGPGLEPRGEFTLVLEVGLVKESGASSATDDDDEDVVAAARALLAAKRAAGLSLSVAAKQIARELDLSKSDVYDIAIQDEKQQKAVGNSNKSGESSS